MYLVISYTHSRLISNLYNLKIIIIANILVMWKWDVLLPILSLSLFPFYIIKMEYLFKLKKTYATVSTQFFSQSKQESTQDIKDLFEWYRSNKPLISLGQWWLHALENRRDFARFKKPYGALRTLKTVLANCVQWSVW